LLVSRGFQGHHTCFEHIVPGSTTALWGMVSAVPESFLSTTI
jgi:hypothetical protein